MIGRIVAWTIVALTAIELSARDVARRSLVQVAIDRTPGLTILVLLASVAALAATAARPRRGHAAILLAALFCVGVAAQLSVGARLQSDGFYYFAYLRSLAFDRDVDFNNDYRLLGLGDKTYLFDATPTGYAHSAWTIGPAIVWSPFFAAGHLVAVGLQRSGAAVATDGTSYPYRQAVCVASLAYGLLGCWFAYRFTRQYATAGVAAAAVAIVTAGSFMLWYLVREPSMTHAPSMAAVAGFVWLWSRSREGRTLREWALLGAIAGLMSMIRWQNALFMLLPACDAVPALVREWRGRDRQAIRALVAGCAVFLACAVVAFLPQMLAWKSIYGAYIARSPIGPAIRWRDPHIVDILWSARNGLFSTSPVLYLAALGLIVFARVRPAIGVPALLAVALMTYFNACIQDWWGSAGFGGRRFDGTIPLFALGAAAFIQAAAALARRYATAFVTAALAALVVWNIALMAAAQAGVIRIGETVRFDRAWGAQVREVHAWFGNPFTYPASLVFALRNGVSPSEYDLLSTNRFLSDPLQPHARIDIGAEDEWLVEEGWHAPEREGTVTYRWTMAAARLRVPLDHPDRLHVEIRLHAFGYPGAPPQTLVVAANGHACTPLPIGFAWQTVECLLDARAWRSGLNHLSLTFAWARSPAEVGLGGDSRILAAAIDSVNVSVAR
jgi:Dolichyl-phosphate-mannose-protein mannosyltransferase